MEVGQQVLTLNLIHSQLDLSVCVILRALQVGQVDLDDTTLQSISSVLQTGGLVDQSLTNGSVFKGGWGLDVEPFLSGERVYDSLLQSLLSLGQSLVFTNSHYV